MSISCKCLNVVVKLAETEPESLARFDLDAYLTRKRQQQQLAKDSATKATTPSDDHFLFFKEAHRPVRCLSIEVQFDGLLRKVRLFDEWDLSQCRNCACCVYALNVNESTPVSAGTVLVNPRLLTNQEQLNARMADENYSPAFGILLNGFSPSYSDLADKGKLLARAKSDNQYVRLLRAYMEQETEAANERIHRFTEQEFAVLKLKRERAEQDCLILAKLSNNVPELLHSISSSSDVVAQPATTTVDSAEQTTMLRSSVSPMVATTGTNDSSAGSQLETPPPTPEYLPMSTGNSPPMMTAAVTSANSRQQANTVSSTSSSSVSAADQSSPSSGAKISSSARTYNRASLGYSNSQTNNNIVSFNNTRGAISSRQTPSVMMTAAAAITPTALQHSSTNSQQQHRRLVATSSFESDCMFDIDGMDNDKSPLSNTLSDEEELGFDESIGNNNDDGMYIPSRHMYGRQNSSIAKSLPISMPQVMTQFRANEEDFEEITEDNVDIAASIKALARSVHGDTVFGDLPRPQIQRFSTQI
ncbi:uncharacterized protein LOC128734439 [Sabethes cyaneus]|uniref:uncharacterized protein LOC128734439 n=1 Tax=Sabethes cyaneus TaxID=53552 RepID=UPI00237DCB94|nr:uncharacterized protein LOC128734439 [Sabethes cyaneus]